jgi:hypothetical protein
MGKSFEVEFLGLFETTILRPMKFVKTLNLGVASNPVEIL